MDVNKVALRLASPFVIIFFLIAFIANWYENNFLDGILNGIVGGLVFGGISYLISRSVVRNKITFKWWQWLVYIVGWLVGAWNLVFWLIMYGIHMAKNYGEPFFNKDFHRIVYVWGIVMGCFFFIVIVGYFLFFMSSFS